MVSYFSYHNYLHINRQLSIKINALSSSLTCLTEYAHGQLESVVFNKAAKCTAQCIKTKRNPSYLVQSGINLASS